jgi:hypothetical protein
MKMPEVEVKSRQINEVALIALVLKAYSSILRALCRENPSS